MRITAKILLAFLFPQHSACVVKPVRVVSVDLVLFHLLVRRGVFERNMV